MLVFLSLPTWDLKSIEALSYAGLLLTYVYYNNSANIIHNKTSVLVTLQI